MTPQFSITEKGRWKLAIDASPEEMEILRCNRFEHRVVFKAKYEELEIDVWSDDLKDKWVKKEHTTTLEDFSDDDGTPLSKYCTYYICQKGDIEEWEAQVTKRLAAISADI